MSSTPSLSSSFSSMPSPCRRDGRPHRRPLRRLSRRLQRLLGDGVQHRVPASPVELGRNPDAEPHAPLARTAPLRGTADHDHRLARGAALVPPAVLVHGPQGAQGAPPVSPAQARALFTRATDAWPCHRREYRALLGALLVILILLLLSSTAIYFLERDAQPDKFGSIPAAAWWALSTLTTVGYGDVVPITALGKRRHRHAAR